LSAALIIKGVKLVAALGVTKVVTDIIKVNTIQETTIQKVMVNVGGFVLGSMIVDKASEHVNGAIDAITEKAIEIEQEKKELKNVEAADEVPE
jgi:hypothetical protein